MNGKDLKGRPISLENAQSAVNGKEVVFVEVYDVDVRLGAEIQILSEEYEGIVKLINGFRIGISKNSEEKTTNCMVNIDVGMSGEILSIEVIESAVSAFNENKFFVAIS